MRPDSDEFMISSIAEMAAQFRASYRLDDDSPIRVHVPAWYAARLIAAYGSLQAAADAFFDPGRVEVVNEHFWRVQGEVKENVERQLTQPSACSLDDLTRIAFGD